MTSLLLALSLLAANPLGSGNHTRTIEVDGLSRSYVIHVPKKYDPKQPMPAVLVFHGAGMNAWIMTRFCGLNKTADEAGFIAVYPNGTGVGPFLTFNAGGLKGKMAKMKPDDVVFVSNLIDDLAGVLNIDKRRVFATGMSNGGMMCYRLAAELSDKIAAIAPVGGTMAIEQAEPNRPVPVMHFHGTDDDFVPLDGFGNHTPKFLTLKSVKQTIQIWAELNHCDKKPVVEKLEDKADDGMSVTMKTYRPKEGGAEVVLVEIDGGGHTWPGEKPFVGFIGKSTQDISANAMMWEFFQRHRMP